MAQIYYEKNLMVIGGDALRGVILILEPELANDPGWPIVKKSLSDCYCNLANPQIDPLEHIILCRRETLDIAEQKLGAHSSWKFIRRRLLRVLSSER